MKEKCRHFLLGNSFLKVHFSSILFKEIPPAKGEKKLKKPEKKEKKSPGILSNNRYYLKL
jgi:hypothetical protein